MKPRRPPPFRGPRPTARTLALQVLMECRPPERIAGTERRSLFVQEILDRHLGQASLSPADRRLATQLVYGVLRRRGTLHALLRPLVSRQPHQVEPWLWNALALGAYQLALLTQIPPHAALYETVQLAVHFGRPGARGFLNGVLRSFAALLTPDAAAGPAADALPLENGGYRRLSRPVLPEPAAHPVEYLAAAFSLPSWLVERWLPRFGVDECQRLGFWFAGPSPLTLRCNPLRISRDALLAAWQQAGHTATTGAHAQAVRLLDGFPLRDLPGYAEGWFSVQDESSMRVASALAPEPGSSILDLCSAPGGKTTHLAELMGNRGRIVACDVDERRLRTVSELAQRLGLGIIETCRLDSAQPDEAAPPGPFDAVLVDVPCSNTGVLGRRPEVRWRLQPEDLRQLVALQERLLHLAAGRVRRGGVVVYSTCSIEPEENQQLVQTFLNQRPDFHLEAEEESSPGRPSDGGYWARLRRVDGTTDKEMPS
jgi:16S rRNA (cytosine967-C5)-methyltransferase